MVSCSTNRLNLWKSHELIRAIDVPAKTPVSQQQQVFWKPPALGFVKINTDAALDVRSGNAGAALVVRGHDGSFVAARFTNYKGISSPFVGESLACRDAMILAIEQGWSKIEIGTDCQNFTEDWKERRRRDRSEVGPIYYI